MRVSRPPTRALPMSCRALPVQECLLVEYEVVMLAESCDLPFEDSGYWATSHRLSRIRNVLVCHLFNIQFERSRKRLKKS